MVELDTMTLKDFDVTLVLVRILYFSWSAQIFQFVCLINKISKFAKKKSNLGLFILFSLTNISA